MRQKFETFFRENQNLILGVLNYLKSYLKNPVDGLRKLPDWNWEIVLLVQTATTAACGVLSGLVAKSIGQFFFGLLFFPIIAVICSTVASGFLYYTFFYFFKFEFSLRKLYTIVVLCSFPFLALHIFSALLPPISVLGFAVFSLLLIVALSEHSVVPRKQIIKLVAAIYGVYIIFWMANIVQDSMETRKYKEFTTPESMELLRKEMSK
jgi:hypothetical protein